MKTCVVILTSPLKESTYKWFSEPLGEVCLLKKVYLTEDAKTKILKKDITLNIEALVDSGDILVCVGADAYKHVAKRTGIIKNSGIFFDNIVGIIDPDMIHIDPTKEEVLVNSIKSIHAVLTDSVPAQTKRNLVHITIPEQLEEYLQKLRDAPYLAVDIESSGFNPLKDYILGVAIGISNTEGIYINEDVIDVYFDELQEIFWDKVIIFHNAKFDMKWLTTQYGFKFNKIEDTLLLHYVLNEKVGTHGLKDLAIKFSDLGPYEDELDRFKKEYCRINKMKQADFSYAMIPSEILAEYATRDGVATIILFEKFKPLVDKNPRFKKLYEEILMPASKALQYMEEIGANISKEKLENEIRNYDIEIQETMSEILNFPEVQELESETGKPFNPNSVQQLQRLLFDKLKLPPIELLDNDKEGYEAFSTGKEVLKQLDHPIAEAILDLRTTSKVRNTYLENIKNGLDYDGRLRTNFNIAGTTSGRLSSSGHLNFQNLPRDDLSVKSCFVAEKDFLIYQGDLSTAEVYCAAVLSKEPFFQQAFIDKVDFHSYVAKAMFKLPCSIDEVKKLFPLERQRAKAITFGILYGAGPGKIAETAGCTFDEAKQFIKLYFNNARTLKRWIDAQKDFMMNNKYIYSYFGRKRRLPELDSPKKGAVVHALNSGFNFLVQSVASDLTLLAIIDLVNWVEQENLHKVVKPFCTVHDSIIAEVHKDYGDLYKNKLYEFMTKDRGIMIPGCPIGVDIDCGESWDKAK